MKAILNNLPDLSDFRTIPAEKIKEFRDQGHLLVSQVLDREEVSAYRDILVEAAHTCNTEKRRLEDRDTYGKAFLQIMNLWRSDERVKFFVLSRRLAKMAADLLGVENVRLYHDQALFKEPGGGPTPWHQDQYYWPLDTTNTITIWMPLMDINTEMGMLTFASGSHKKGSVLEYEISDQSEGEFERYIKKEDLPISRADAMQAGDATWHYGYTIHNAPGNHSGITREVMTVIYVADGAKITEPQNKYQENDRQTWLRGRQAGEAVDSDLNPLLL
ncbi:phytanoyl-CoA dioxygenase family protein [Flavitalea flava]